MYEPRFYRQMMHAKGLKAFTVRKLETDLRLFAERDLTPETKHLVQTYRQQIRQYIQKSPQFLTSLQPLPLDDQAPAIVQHMLRASAIVGVGPMAAVAGAMAQYVGAELLAHTEELIVENGGDIFIKTSCLRRLRLYCKGPFANRLNLELPPTAQPFGICTSSGTLGHSFSRGSADAVVVRANDTLLADAAATGLGNMIHDEDDIPRAISHAQAIAGLQGVMIVVKNKLGVWGNIKFVEVSAC